MKVTKRNGKLEDVNLNKVSERIKKLSEGLQVDYIKIATKTIQGLYDGVTTKELDNLAAEISATLGTIHPDYGVLAGRIEVSNLHKETPKHFIQKLYNLYIVTGIISKEFYEFCYRNQALLESIIDYERDYLIDYFGVKTLKKSYLLRVNGVIMERPQDMWMRVAAFINMDQPERIKETYDLLSQKYYTHATPTLFNAGTIRPQLSSCFLLDMSDDSIDGIYKSLSDCAKISQSAGGIGLAVHKIRSAGSPIKGTGGVSNGLVPMLRVFDATARYVDQGGGKRKGSIAIYLEPWHSDIFEVLDLKKNTGKEELRARDLFYAMWIPDLFMQRVKTDGEWTLFDPKQTPDLIEAVGDRFVQLYVSYEAAGKVSSSQPQTNGVHIHNVKGTTIKARDLWNKILESQIETGVPFMLYKDSANSKSNQQNLGTIKSSNLCVAANTLILTSDGYRRIKHLENKEVEIWNGNQWSKTKIVKTGYKKLLDKIEFSSGDFLTCTPEHKFYILRPKKENKQKFQEIQVNASDLQIGDRLIRYNLPLIEKEIVSFPHPYTHGLFCADGHVFKGHYRLTLYGKKIELVPFLDIHSSSYELTSEGSLNLTLPKTLRPKYELPLFSSVTTKVAWLSGYFDGDGYSNGNDIEVCSVNLDFIFYIKKLLETLGILSKLSTKSEEVLKDLPKRSGGLEKRLCDKAYKLYISGHQTTKLLELGLSCKRLKIVPTNKTNRLVTNYNKVVAIKKANLIADTYCVNEPLEHKAVFNGILTGNCTEIIEYTSPEETAVCNLASISLPSFINPFMEDGYDYDLLYKVSRTVTRNLNKVIDVNYYPVKEAERSNKLHRPIGIGVQGLADTFALLKLPFDSDAAKAINKKIFEIIYKGAVDESIDLARKDGTYSSYQGSPASNGRLQFDLWGVDRSKLHFKWEDTFENLRTYGLRNSLLLAPMPTASTSQILGNNECFEPFTSNIYTRRTLAGEFIIVNKYLINDLIRLGLWNDRMRQDLIAGNGSVQHMDLPKDLKDLYKTVWEISQRVIIDMAADRGPFICQSQSMNIYMNNPTINKLTSMHFYGWEKGLKTGQYYLRSQSAVDAIKFTIDKQSNQHTTQATSGNEIRNNETAPILGGLCSLDDPENCEACSG